MSWHYQPVYTENDGVTDYTLCECYIRDDDGTLESWTEKMNIAPSGETPMELIHDLMAMLNDAIRWEPVRFEDLKEGMKLVNRTGLEDRDY